VKPFEHKPAFSRSMPSKPNRLKGNRWTILRNWWIRNHPFCAHCNMPGQEVHHIVPRQHAPERTYDVGNLKTLCRACHHALHNDPNGLR
jgi:5-methylcytosine-specific restriction endonuclease McrA